MLLKCRQLLINLYIRHAYFGIRYWLHIEDVHIKYYMHVYVVIFALESNYFLTVQHFLLPHLKMLTGGRGCQAPIWAHILLHIGLEHRNSCQTGETNKF